jgi:uncharacterized protein (TIGR03437 family)
VAGNVSQAKCVTVEFRGPVTIPTLAFAVQTKLDMRKAILLILFTVPLFGQDFDTSNNAALHGDYFIREILVTGQNGDGTISSGLNAIGVASFDGAGNYTFNGASGGSASGVYGVAANGMLFMQSVIDNSQYAYGGISSVGPNAFVASATEGTTADLLVAIPAGTSTTSASLQGNYTAGYVSFPKSDVTQVRQASLNFTADGAGNLANVSGSGTALNLGGTAGALNISGASYTLSGEGSGMLNLGASSSSQVLSGSLNFYVSADGNLFMAGTPGGMDLVVGGRAFTGTANNGSWNNVFYTGAMEDAYLGGQHSIDAFYGSWNSNGSGSSIVHERFQPLAQPGVYDYTFSSADAVQSNATSAPADIPYNFTLAAGGKAFIAVGNSGLYSLMVGFAAPQASGSGVFLNPLGVVNAANYAPITNPIAPGEIITLFGSGLSSSAMNAAGLPLATSLNGVQVMINGMPAPLVYVSPTQITAVVPQQISPDNGVDIATLQVINNNVQSNTTMVYTNFTAPGIFAASGSGTGPAAAQVNNAPVSSSNPANIGSTVVLFATGLGTVSPSVADGAAAPTPPAMTDDTDYLFVGGQQENLQFDGLTPGLAALFQMNAALVSGTPSGTNFVDVSTPDAYTSEATLGIGSGAAIAQKARLAKRSRTVNRPRRVRVPESVPRD